MCTSYTKNYPLRTVVEITCIITYVNDLLTDDHDWTSSVLILVPILIKNDSVLQNCA